MNRTYRQLLLEGAEKGTYRKRPVETLDKVEQIKNKIETEKLTKKKKRTKEIQQKTPTGIAISQAKIKSGKKALREQLDQQEFNRKLAELRRIGAPQKDIEAAYQKEFQIQKFQRDLQQLRDQPEEYLAKLQQLKHLQQNNTVEQLLSEQTSQLKSQNLALNQLVSLYGGLLTPAQLLESLPQFQDLSAPEKKLALSNLQKQVPRDKAKQKVLLKQIIEQPDEVIESLKEGIKMAVPIKAKAEIIDEPKSVKKTPKTKSKVEADKTLFATPMGTMITTLQPGDEPEQLRPMSSIISQAGPVEDQDDEDEIIIHPQLKPIVPAVAQQIQANDSDVSEEEAMQDAVEVAQAVTQDLQQMAPPPPPPMPLLQPVPKVDAGIPVAPIIPPPPPPPPMPTEGFLPPPPPPPMPTAEQLAGMRAPTLKAELKKQGIQPKTGKGSTEENRNLLLNTITQGVKLKSAKIRADAEPAKPAVVNLSVAEQAALAAKKRADQSSKTGDLDAKMAEQKKQREAERKALEEEEMAKRDPNLMLKKQFEKKFGKVQNISEPEDDDDDDEEWGTPEPSPVKTRSQRAQESSTKKKVPPPVAPKPKGKGFMPLDYYPSHVIAGSLAHHINRVRNKRRLMKITVRNPFEDTENEGYRKRLALQTIRDVRGGGIFGSFLPNIFEALL